MTAEALKAEDIVITTYATLAADHGGAALLYGMEWYRIVLDEGEPTVHLPIPSRLETLLDRSSLLNT